MQLLVDTVDLSAIEEELILKPATYNNDSDDTSHRLHEQIVAHTDLHNDTHTDTHG